MPLIPLRSYFVALSLLALGCAGKIDVQDTPPTCDGNHDGGGAPPAPSQGDAGAPVADAGSSVPQPGPGLDAGSAVDAGLDNLPIEGTAVATFSSISLYWTPPSAPLNDTVHIRYRKLSDPTWRPGHDLWYDSRQGVGYQPRPVEARGSIVFCDPGTDYVVEFGMPQSDGTTSWVAQVTTTTWSETFPIGTTLTPWTGTNTTLTNSSYLGSRSGSSRSQVLLMNQSGTATGYTLYDLTGATAQAPNTSNNFAVVISGSYMILKGLKTVGGQDGIFVDPGSNHIVIEDCELTSYGRSQGTPLPGGLGGDWGVNEDSGIFFPDESYGPILDTKQFVVQRNKIHNPFAGANSWDYGHPLGPTAISMYPTGGDMVFRYNESYSTTDGTLGGPPDFAHFHEDGLIMGGNNDQGIGPDIDVYKNLTMDYFDDGMETDGDGTNDRVWGNYFDYGGASGVSSTPTTLGPVYLFRNVYNRGRVWFFDPWGNERDRLYMFKSGGFSAAENGGRRYLYQNTSLQPPYTSESAAAGPNSLGAGFGAGGTGQPGSGDEMLNTIARNNVFEMWKSSWATFEEYGSGNDFDYDLSNGQLSETNGVGATPEYQSGNGWSSYYGGKYRLAPGTPGHDDGVVIPNFNDQVPPQYQYQGAGPDRGAHEDGTPDMQFGTTATGY